MRGSVLAGRRRRWLVGAFIFGIGMQLGGGCASGTLFSVGGGSTRMLVTLLVFVAGSVIGTAHIAVLDGAARVAADLARRATAGRWPALAVSLAVFGAIAVAHDAGRAAASRPAGRDARRRRARAAAGCAARGRSSPAPSASPLVNLATLLLAGRPWGVTSAFALWGAKAARPLGVDVDDVALLVGACAGRGAAARSVFDDVTSVMDVGIMLGALLAALLAGRFAPVWRSPARSLAAAVIGGLLLGYGARIAYGCNIGAYFSGIASGSLHGWLWLPCAFVGNVVGTYLRPAFGLSVERTTLPKC